MARLSRMYLLGMVFSLVACFGTACGISDSATTTQEQWLSRTPPQPINQTTQLDLHADVLTLSTVPWTYLRQRVMQKAPTPTAYVQPSKRANVTSPRYLDLRLKWKGLTFRITSDLQAPSFSLDITILQSPLRLQCTSGKAKRKVKIIQMAKMPRISNKAVAKKQPTSQNKLSQFERDALELVTQIWVPIHHLWQAKRCLAKMRCNSQLYSDITLDIQGGELFSCKMVLLDRSQK